MKNARDSIEPYRSLPYAITLILSFSDTVGIAMPKILKALSESLPWCLAEFWMVDRRVNKLRFAESWHKPSEIISEFVAAGRHMTFSPDEGLPGRVWVSGKPCWVEDVVVDSHFLRAKIAGKTGLRTAVGFPLIAVSAMNSLMELAACEVGLSGVAGFPARNENEMLGVIVLFSGEKEKPDKGLVELLRIVSMQISQFIKLKQTEEMLRSKIDFEKTVANISTRFVNTLDFSNEISVSLSDIGRLCKATRVCLFQFPNERNSVAGAGKIDRVYEWHADGIPSNIRNLQDVYSARYSWLVENFDKGAMVYITDDGEISQDIAFEKGILKTLRAKSLLLIPVRVEEKLLGFMSLDNVVAIDGLHEDNITLLHMMGEIMGSAIIRKQTESLVKHMAYHDSLTNLPNRLLFKDRLQMGCMQAKRNRKMLAVLCVDLDKFKSVNDTLGHHAGDLLLKAVAERLTRCVRGSDTVARTGGDEFTIILPDLTHALDAAVVAQKVLDVIEKPYVIESNKVCASASVGISIYPQDSHTLDDLVKMADKAMYCSKQSDRNTFRFYKSDMNKHVQTNKE